MQFLYISSFFPPICDHITVRGCIPPCKMGANWKITVLFEGFFTGPQMVLRLKNIRKHTCGAKKRQSGDRIHWRLNRQKPCVTQREDVNMRYKCRLGSWSSPRAHFKATTYFLWSWAGHIFSDSWFLSQVNRFFQGSNVHTLAEKPCKWLRTIPQLHEGILKSTKCA